MYFHIRKRTLGLILFLVIVGVTAAGFFTFFVHDGEKFTCLKSPISSTRESCGLFTSSRDNSLHMVSAKILRKQKTGSRYTLTIGTNDSAGKGVEKTVLLPPESIGATVTRKSEDTKETNSTISPSELFATLRERDEVVLFVLTPDQQTIDQATKQFGKSDFVECYAYNQTFIDLLKRKTSSSLQSTLGKFMQPQCSLSVLQILVYETK